MKLSVIRIPLSKRIENRDFLEKSLDKFSDVEKEFISMRYFDNKTQKDIAQKMGVSQMYNFQA